MGALPPPRANRKYSAYVTIRPLPGYCYESTIRQDVEMDDILYTIRSYNQPHSNVRTGQYFFNTGEYSTKKRSVQLFIRGGGGEKQGLIKSGATALSLSIKV